MYVRTSVQTLGEGEGSPKESVIPFWQEIAPYFWATSVAKRLFNGVEVLNLRKNILYLYMERKTSKEYSVAFL